MTPINYLEILKQLKTKISDRRYKVSRVINTELLVLYWEIGSTILEQQSVEGWGTKVIDNLSKDLRSEFIDFKGLSVRNLKYMRSFAEAYPNFLIVQQTAAQLESPKNQSITIVQQLAAQLPWGHHHVLLDKIKEATLRSFYVSKSVKNGWSRSILVEQIRSKLHLREGNAISNFKSTLPAIQSDLAQQTLKNPYIYDFLSYRKDIKERDLELGLIKHLKSFMLELGKGFAYVGNQKNLVVEGDDFFLDLLFYNFQLHCFVVVELKVGDFKPEYAGKLNFYVNTVNEQLKTAVDKPTIGVFLCRTPNETVVKYSLQGVDSPIGVSDYNLAAALPENLKTEMPTEEEFEDAIAREYEELKSPIDTIKQMLTKIKEPSIKESYSEETSLRIFHKIVEPLRARTELCFKEISQMFADFNVGTKIESSSFYIQEEANQRIQKSPRNSRYGLDVYGKGFLQVGINTFSSNAHLSINLHEYKYEISLETKQNIIYENVYHILPTEEELDSFVERIEEIVIEDIQDSLERITNI